MPTYEYICPTCQANLAVVRNISDQDPGYVCDNCKIQLIRAYSPVEVSFKGSGFYSKDK